MIYVLIYVLGIVTAYVLNVCATWGYFANKYPLHERREETLAKIRGNVAAMAAVNAVFWPAGIFAHHPSEWWWDFPQFKHAITLNPHEFAKRYSKAIP